ASDQVEEGIQRMVGVTDGEDLAAGGRQRLAHGLVPRSVAGITGTCTLRGEIVRRPRPQARLSDPADRASRRSILGPTQGRAAEDGGTVELALPPAKLGPHDLHDGTAARRTAFVDETARTRRAPRTDGRRRAVAVPMSCRRPGPFLGAGAGPSGLAATTPEVFVEIDDGGPGCPARPPLGTVEW